MRPISVAVGPLAAASATNISPATQLYAANQNLAITGALASYYPNTICAQQSPGSSAFTLNGFQTLNGIAFIQNQYVTITSGGNDSGISFTIVGTSLFNAIVTENVRGTNASTAASKNTYYKILSITPTGAVASTVNVGSFIGATTDNARKILFTCAANESANSVYITGTNWNGDLISETLPLVNATTTYSVLDYKTVSSMTVANTAAGTISVGTTGVACSPWVRLDEWSTFPTAIQCSVSGTVNYTLQQCLQDPNSPTNPVAPALMTWINSQDPSVVNSSVSVQTNYTYAPLYCRLLLNSGTGSVTAVISQNSNAQM